jgi:hypothetical protein
MQGIKRVHHRPWSGGIAGKFELAVSKVIFPKEHGFIVAIG